MNRLCSAAHQHTQLLEQMNRSLFGILQIRPFKKPLAIPSRSHSARRRRYTSGRPAGSPSPSAGSHSTQTFGGPR
jgi:hypothetical protein